jgi:hypothetical protein
LKNGEHFGDYIKRVDVPGSQFAFALRDQQIRYLSVTPKRQETIKEKESDGSGRQTDRRDWSTGPMRENHGTNTGRQSREAESRWTARSFTLFFVRRHVQSGLLRDGGITTDEVIRYVWELRREFEQEILLRSRKRKRRKQIWFVRKWEKP